MTGGLAVNPHQSEGRDDQGLHLFAPDKAAPNVNHRAGPGFSAALRDDTPPA